MIFSSYIGSAAGLLHSGLSGTETTRQHDRGPVWRGHAWWDIPCWIHEFRHVIVSFVDCLLWPASPKFTNITKAHDYKCIYITRISTLTLHFVNFFHFALLYKFSLVFFFLTSMLHLATLWQWRLGSLMRSSGWDVTTKDGRRPHIGRLVTCSYIPLTFVE